MCENDLSVVFFGLGASTTNGLFILLQRPGLSVSSVGPSRNVSNCTVIVTNATALCDTLRRFHLDS
jgi:lauroyl/myristoyl acyltransferase